ncbi:MAG: ChbG/HpnK family deacetylase [bacterium]|nr:ChbG/HpnK family deacetylase [bacterium]
MTLAADDYGLDPEIDRAIQELTKKKIVNKVSVLANPTYPTELPKLSNHVETGLHVNLTTPWPKQTQNHPPSPWQLLRASLKRRLSTDVLIAQISQQLALLKSRGLAISFLDTHHHVHLIPRILHALIHVAQHQNIEHVRCLTMRFRHFPGYVYALVKYGFISQIPRILTLYTCGLAMKASLDRAGLSYCPNLVIMPLATGGDYPGLLQTLLHQFQHQNAEFVTHPGFASQHLPNEPYVKGRTQEYQALLSCIQTPGET